nr:MAG TPA: hypothetical protein [Caudoviricetes sp.]
MGARAGGVTSPSLPGRLSYLSFGGSSSRATFSIIRIITPAATALRISFRSSTVFTSFLIIV